MTYNPKTSKKCHFANLAKDPLRPLAKKKHKITDYNFKGKILKEWRDGWFKGQYESEQ